MIGIGLEIEIDDMAQLRIAKSRVGIGIEDEIENRDWNQRS
jgi:hypothetical protein